ncbi:hypothetical protein HDU98_003978, partial [Podochytrium sp. JEL0797]
IDMVKSIIDRLKRTTSKATPPGPGRCLPVAELKNGITNGEPPVVSSRGSGKRSVRVFGVMSNDHELRDGGEGEEEGVGIPTETNAGVNGSGSLTFE